MGRLRRALWRRPSAAMAVATVAVLIAMGAPGYAAQTLRSVLFAQRAGNSNKLDGFKASKKPRPNDVLVLDSHGRIPASADQEAPRVAGPQGPQGLRGPQGLQGLQGPQGFPGTPGSALAYSVIMYGTPDDGGPKQWLIEDTLSKKLDNTVNVGDTGHPEAGVICVHDLPFTATNAVATPGPFGPHGGFDVEVDTKRPGNSLDGVHGCPANTDVIVYVTDPAQNYKLIDPPDQTDTIFFELN